MRKPHSADQATIFAKTMSFHYDKHHKSYVDNLNKLIAGTEYADLSLEKIIAGTAGKPERTAIFNNATLKIYAGAPHGLAHTHKDQLNADLLAFLKA
jgi:superoxide dismutase